MASPKCLRSRGSDLTSLFHSSGIFSTKFEIHKNKMKSEVRLPDFEQAYAGRSQTWLPFGET